MKDCILITGAFGYIGGRIAAALGEAYKTVRCGTSRNILHPPAWMSNMQMTKIEWSSIDSLSEACKDVDCVIHLAAMNEINSMQDPIGALKMNGLSSLALLEAAKRAGVRRFIYFSTAHVYGTPLCGEISEISLTRPTHPYAISHKVAEDYILAAHDLKNIEGVVLRLSNGFGAPMTADINRWTLLVNDLCRQAVETGVLQLKTSGTQVRDFIPLGDIVLATKHLVKLETKALGNGLFNLGSGQSISIFDMAKKVAERWKILTGKEIDIIRPVGHGMPASPLTYSCKKIISTGFLPSAQINLEVDETLKMCVEAFGK